ncbi:hypothetical protein JTB14_036072 [Gonioctena quinquepunctata]|nr:hypothetical protein JTB14_036072 [Gonioctena quinquepunctata]
MLKKEIGNIYQKLTRRINLHMGTINQCLNFWKSSDIEKLILGPDLLQDRAYLQPWGVKMQLVVIHKLSLYSVDVNEVPLLNHVPTAGIKPECQKKLVHRREAVIS